MLGDVNGCKVVGRFTRDRFDSIVGEILGEEYTRVAELRVRLKILA